MRRMAKMLNASRALVNGLTKSSYNYPEWILDYSEQVAAILKICYRDALMIVQSNVNRRTPMVNLVERCKLLKTLDVCPYSLHELLHCIKLQSRDLQHRYWLLRELGVKHITLYDIGYLHEIIRMPGIRFKARFAMSADENLVENIFNSVEEHPKNMPSLQEYQNSMSVVDIYNHYFLCYKTWKIGMPGKRYYPYYNRQRTSLQILSFRLFKEMEHMLKTEFGIKGPLSHRMYPFFVSTPKNVKVLLSKLLDFDFDTDNLKKIIMSNPQLVLNDPHNVYSVCKVLRDHGIPVEPAIALCKNAKLFILDSQLVIQRLKEFAEDSFLGLWCRHRSVITMIIRHQCVWRNLYILRAMSSIQNCGITTVTLPENLIYKFFQRNCNIYPYKYVKYLLDLKLDLKDNSKVVKYLQRNTRWCLLSAVHMNEILQFLKKLFPKEAICDNIHVIMYSRSDVGKVLKELKNIGDFDSYTYSHQLALCVYVLEKQKYPIMGSRPRLMKSAKRVVHEKASVDQRINNMLDTIIFSGNPEAPS